MSTFELEKITWEDVAELDKSRSVVFFPISPVEEHGPHLPLGTDFFGAIELTRLAAIILDKEHPEINCLLFPGVPLGSADTTGDFPGTISVSSNTLMRIIYDVLLSFAKSGFLYVIIVNHHYDIYHMKAILMAIDKVQKTSNLKAFEPLGTAFFATDPQPVAGVPPGFNLDFSKESHAEFEETSFIKYKYPELLREVYRDLPPVHINLIRKYLIGQTTLKKMGADRGYIGTPSQASSEYGQAYLAEKSRVLADSALKLYQGQDLPHISLKFRLAMQLIRLK